MDKPEPYSVDKLTAEARRLAADYRRMTGKTLPLSGEIAVNDAIRLLDLETPDDPGASYDALRRSASGFDRIQIKGRVLFDQSKAAARLGQLKLDQCWDEILLVLMDENYEPIEIYRATRATIDKTLGQKPPKKRGAMTIAQFKIVGRLLWSETSGLEQEAG